MAQGSRAAAIAAALLAAISTTEPTLAQGGILRVHALDSPPSLSMHEEVDAVPARAMMGVFNNLVMFDQHVKQNSLQSIVPDLATGWSWSEDGTHFPIARGRQVARWQALYCQGRQMHLGPADWQIERQASSQSP